MARRRQQQFTMARGELDPQLAAREDADIYFAGLRRARNVVVFPNGHCIPKPGQRFHASLRPRLAALAVTVTLPSGGNTADIIDADLTTQFTTTSTFSPASTDAAVIHLDIGATLPVHGLSLHAFEATAADADSCLKVQSSPDNSVWSDFGPAQHIRTAKRSRVVALEPGTSRSARYWRVVIDQPSASIGYFKAGGVTLHGSGVPLSAPRARIVDFAYGDGDELILVFTDGWCDCYDSAGSWKSAIHSPYTDAQLPELTWIQSLDTVLLHHRDVPPHRIQRQGNDSQWTSAATVFDHLPLEPYDPPYGNAVTEVQKVHHWNFNTGNEFTLTLEGETTTPITFTGTSTPELATDAAAVKAALENLRNVDAGLTVTGTLTAGHVIYTVTFTGGDNASREWLPMEGANRSKPDGIIYVEQDTVGSPGGEALFSATRGWPAAAAFHAGRYLLGGFRERSNGVLYSVAGDFFDLDIDLKGDDAAVLDYIDANQELAVTHLVSGRNLAIFTTSGVHYVDARTILAETPRPYVQATEVGAPYGARIVSLQGALMHLPITRDGVYEFVFSDAEANYTSSPVSWLSQHLMIDLQDLAHRKWRRQAPGDMVFMPRADGKLVVMTALRGQGTSGFTLMEPDNCAYRAVSVTRTGACWMAVQRVIGGLVHLYLEQWNEACMFDAEMVYQLVSPTLTLSGLDHLEGEDVWVWSDAGAQGPFTVSGNAVTLETEVSGTVRAGLWSPPVIETMPLRERDTAGAPSKKTRIFDAFLHVHETGSIAVGCNGASPRSFEIPDLATHGLDMNVTDNLVTGRVASCHHYGYQHDATCVVTQLRPGPMRLLAIELNYARAGGD